MRRRLLLAGALGVGAGLLWGPITGAAPRTGWMRVTWLDVGQGDAALVQFPSGHSMLIDAAGGSPGFDVGTRVIAPAARALGVRRLDWLLLTHADLDHAGGALSAAARLRPLEIWEGIPVPPNPIRRLLRDAAARDGIAWRRLASGHAIEIGPVLLDVLHPAPAQWERQRVRNDDSVVIRLRYGDVEVLLTGDAGVEFETAFAPDPEPPPLRVLKVAHHGSRSSTASAFLRMYRPVIAVISAGRGNLFGHPSREVLQRMNAARVQLFRTDRDGAVTLETNGRAVEMTTMSGRRRGFVSGAPL
jgi:competence protein ComEC